MVVFAVLMFLMFSGSVLSSDESIAVACSINDIDCFGKSFGKFLEKTHRGIPAWNIVAVDPLVISSFEIVFDNEGLIYKYKYLTVTGLRNQQVADFKLDTKAKTAVLNTKGILGTASYKYDLKTDEKGVTHYDVGPETVTCKVVDAPRTEMDPEFQQTLSNDADAKSYNAEKIAELKEKSFCKIAEKAFTYVFHNVREASKAVPSSDFFTDIE